MAFIKNKKGFSRRKVCEFCESKQEYVDYKNTEVLKKYINATGQIKPAGATGTCAKHQRKVSTAIKRARFIALLPYTIIRVRTQR
ncbi:30S ribosomal protein S18 [Mycoplasmopsis pullorum]|uniref:Small ribosomal subunit protein bS18 n=1 Tax=Mycoplasmopsis pullorum TaxID=48003 RepID=A0A1L4FSL9_9BACT|nr:30S ribosomal protein S18 [Mycoplasmopsis pullorum]APJ38615.1 30S ribosomal protein S18 [Mycoplasmopsis pullorum]TNK82525.1 30S ribosomal protein S18 [Mycoplasmopsis pullorum]TNK82767.1 30S ribosomal protein S18 [Mycoplasmopsis pullorum]TNK83904.1 30S ribosomal protein S18 [Mycoplasmopsis pullorum]TNK84626.1 30S ribosomal protein S18 [Mycoplasmopsis pullorum]